MNTPSVYAQYLRRAPVLFMANSDRLCDFGVDYLLAPYPLRFHGGKALRQVGSYRSPDAFWSLYLYRTDCPRESER
jgi:hypothetical protein